MTATGRIIIARPNAGDSHNDLGLYRVAENVKTMPDPPNANDVGWLRVVPVWAGCIKYGYASTGGVGKVTCRYLPYQGLGFPDQHTPSCVVTVAPPPGWPGYDTNELRRARVHATFETHYGEWFLGGFVVDEPGNGYSCRYPPTLTYQFFLEDVDPPSDPYPTTVSPDPQPRCGVYSRTLVMQTDDHNIVAGDRLLLRYRSYDEAIEDPNPPQDYVRIGVDVVAQSGRTISLGNGWPNDSLVDTYGMYVPGDMGSTLWGPAAQSPRWTEPDPDYDPYVWAPYRNVPPWRFSVYKYDPQPVWFLQQKNGSPVPIGAYVAVHQNLICSDNGLRLAWPLDLTRAPYWG